MATNTHDVRMTTNQSLLQKTGKTQAAFVPKLYLMVKDMGQPTPEEPNPERPLISWSKAGDVFCVFDPIEFSRVILPLHFKHNNWQSFVRQLNMYGFHKVNDLLSSSHCHPDTAQAWEFRHPNFKRDRPDLLPMIKRKSTKHHGSSKATTAQAKLQTSSQARETRLHHQIAPSDEASARAGRPFHVYAPYNHPGSALPLTHRPLHGKPPPPPLHISKVNTLPQMSARPPALHPLITHQIQYPHTSHRKIKSFSPPLKPANTKGSSSAATTNTCHNSSMLSSPGSARPTSHNFHPITSQPAQPISHNVQEDKFNHSTFVDEWRSKPEPHQSHSTLTRLEDELRRLNDILSHRDLVGNHIFSVLGLLVELVNLLVNNNRDKNLPDLPDQQQMLSHYMQAAKSAMAKLQNVSHDYHDAGRKCSGAPSTDSMSPVSTDLAERPVIQCKQTQRNSVDPNFKMKDGPASPTRVAHPRCPDRLSSSQSLPPLRTIMESWTPPILNRTHSSGPLPASINRLMNDDSHEHSTTEMSSASDENPFEEPGDDNHEDPVQGDYDDLIEYGSDGLAEDESDEDDGEEGDNQLQEDEPSEEYDGNDSDESGHEETQGHSADGRQNASLSYHRSDISESPMENTASERGTGFEPVYQRDPSASVPVKRSSAQCTNIVLSSNEPAEKETHQHANTTHSSRKRTRIV